jgi:hypothetical protein
MNDNIAKSGRREWNGFFAFYLLLPLYVTKDIYDRRIDGQGLRLAVQIEDRLAYLHLTEYRFQRPR